MRRSRQQAVRRARLTDEILDAPVWFWLMLVLVWGVLIGLCISYQP